MFSRETQQYGLDTMQVTTIKLFRYLISRVRRYFLWPRGTMKKKITKTLRAM